MRDKLGIRCDDDFTRMQQNPREELSADFLTLKSKGYSPFFRVSHLRHRSQEKVLTCNKGQGCSAPAIKAGTLVLSISIPLLLAKHYMLTMQQ